MEAWPVPESVAEPVEAVEGPAGVGARWNRHSRLDLTVIPGLTGNLLAADEKRARGEGLYRALEKGLPRFRALLERP